MSIVGTQALAMAPLGLLAPMDEESRGNKKTIQILQFFDGQLIDGTLGYTDIRLSLSLSPLTKERPVGSRIQ